MPDETPDVLAHHQPQKLKLIGIVALVIAVLVAAAGIVLRLLSDDHTQAWTDAQAVPTVRLISLGGTAVGNFTLPGDVEAFVNAVINAQVSGTVQKWFVDIGAPVKAGQLMAQLDPRPYQATLDQARGQLARDVATLANNQKDLIRYQNLAAQNAISQQQLATQQATVASTIGIVQSDRAAVQSAQLNLTYTHIVAPFDGIVTSRSIDVGQLVVANNTTATSMFTVADQKRLRIYVHVPQNYSGLLRPGMTATFSVPEYPGRVFTATMSASADAIASQSGTQLVQMQIDNSDQALKPGSYAEMRFATPKSGGVRVPVTALIFRDQGMLVAIVDADGKVAMKPIRIATDFGAEVEVDSGLKPDDKVIDNPPDSLRVGDRVRVAS
jgi:RND family efflux transporter MFP subunit